MGSHRWRRARSAAVAQLPQGTSDQVDWVGARRIGLVITTSGEGAFDGAALDLGLLEGEYPESDGDVGKVARCRGEIIEGICSHAISVDGVAEKRRYED